MTSQTAEQRFYLGEVVDWLDPGVFHPEVTIIGPRHWCEWVDWDIPRLQGSGWCYSVQYADSDQGVEIETNLRRKKIPPNPDAVTRTRELECV